MKMHAIRLFALLFFTMFLAGKTFAQQTQGDSTTLQTSVNQTVSDFNIAIGQASRLYNGEEYHPYLPTIKGNALFPLNAESWATGEVTYDGVVYKGVPMMYDIVKDAVVVLLYNHFTMYTLLSNRVHDFSFSGHHFVRINADSLVNDKSGMSTGFYDQIYGGKTQVVARWSKTIQQTASTSIALESFFSVTHDYFILKGNTYYKVNSKGAFFKVLKDKRAALQDYMRKNNLKFNDDTELVMASLAAYYDRL